MSESPFARFSDAQFANLQQQLEMSAATLATLRSPGLEEEMVVRLDFHFDCPSEAAATALADYLREETDYDVQTTGETIRGRTQSTTLDLPKLRQWVYWMCAAGVENGDCSFDGWGAAVPRE